MLSGLSKTRPPLIKICEHPLNANSRFFASQSTTRASPRFSEDEPSHWKRNAYSRSTPSRLEYAKHEQSRPAFGLRPPGKQPWDESDPRFVNEDPNLALRFGEASRTRAKLRQEGKLRVPKGPPQLFPLTEHPESQSLEDRRSVDPPPHQMGHYGLSSDILSMRVEGEETPRKPPAVFEDQTSPTFNGHSSSQDLRTSEPTQYLMIQDFKGLRSDLAPVTDSFIESQLHLVPVQTEGVKLRIDALMKFNTRRDTLDARRRLEEQISTLGDGYDVQMIDKSRYISAVNPPAEEASMAEFASPPTTFDVDKLRNRGSPHSMPSQTLWFGGVPNELLADREGIIAKFSKYGKITDIRTRTGDPRGYMHLDFLLQEDADKCLQELTKRPLFLFGRSLRVDYAPPLVRSQRPSRLRADDRQSLNTVLLSRLPDRLHMNPWDLLDAVSLLGEIVDLRIIRLATSRLPPASAFVDFLHVNDSKKMIEEVTAGRVHSLGPEVRAGYGTKVTARWDDVINPPSDTLRAWGLPLRALCNETILREAFGDNRKLIDIRIPRRPEDSWPIGSIYLQFASVEAAKETFDWMRSDPENPITFFGREIRANFIESGDLWRRSRRKSNTNDDYYDLLLKKKNTVQETISQPTQDEGQEGTRSLSESDIEESH